MPSLRPTGLQIQLLLAALAWLAPAGVRGAAPHGAEIYQAQCASCHGRQGEGTDSYALSLAGDLSVRRLAEIIDATMPDGEPDLCTGAQAQAVARYMHGAFYSPLAQARRRPPRVELSRLTARQYQQTLLDLAQSFSWRGKQDGRRGITAQYYRGDGPSREQRVFNQTVPGVAFSLIQSGLFEQDYLFPKPDKDIPPTRRAKLQSVFMQWRGGLLAAETGPYELVVRTNAGFQLWLNGEKPLIDRRVQSGEERGGRAKIYLIEGRAYPLRLEVTRVFEEDVQVDLAWRTPAGLEEAIPARALVPSNQPGLLVIETPLPPDDQSAGFVRGNGVSAGWDEATTRAAFEAVEKIVASLPKLLKLGADAKQSRSKAQAFCLEFADRAFRHPVSDEEQNRIVDRYFQQDTAWEQSAKLSLLATLKSPRFLYPEVGLIGASKDWRAAGRLALALWDSIPDEPLNLLARQKKLNSREQIARQARWMLKDPRAAAKLLAFFCHWLEIDRQGQLARDPQLFAGFDEQVAADMRTSLRLFLRDAAQSPDCDLGWLLLSDEVYLNERLADFLGAESLERPGFHIARLESDARAGVITHPYVVARHAYYRESSPIHRGVFLARHVFGRTLAPPPKAVEPVPPEHQPDLTTRERVAQQTSPAACQHCHVLINGLGFSLEQFDAVGRLRQEEHGKPIDASGGYVTTQGERVDFQHAHDLAEFLAASQDVQRAFVVQLFEHVANQPIMAYGTDAPDRLLKAFQEADGNIHELLVQIATTIALHQNE